MTYQQKLKLWRREKPYMLQRKGRTRRKMWRKAMVKRLVDAQCLRSEGNFRAGLRHLGTRRLERVFFRYDYEVREVGYGVCDEHGFCDGGVVYSLYDRCWRRVGRFEQVNRIFPFTDRQIAKVYDCLVRNWQEETDRVKEIVDDMSFYACNLKRPLETLDIPDSAKERIRSRYEMLQKHENAVLDAKIGLAAGAKRRKKSSGRDLFALGIAI